MFPGCLESGGDVSCHASPERTWYMTTELSAVGRLRVSRAEVLCSARADRKDGVGGACM